MLLADRLLDLIKAAHYVKVPPCPFHGPSCCFNMESTIVLCMQLDWIMRICKTHKDYR